MSSLSRSGSKSSGSSSSNVKIAHGAVICKDCDLKGDITIGSRTVIHPKARIVAESGPIVIGECNLIEEQVQIINRHAPDEEGGATMVIGANNVFEVGAHCESLKLGDNNILEAKAYVGRKTVLSTGCVIGAMCHVTTQEVLPDNTVIFGQKYERRVQAEKPASQMLQLDFLTKILPNYHHLRKPQKLDIPK